MTQSKSIVIENQSVAGDGDWGGCTENHWLMNKFHIFIEVVISWRFIYIYIYIYMNLYIYLSKLLELQSGCPPETSQRCGENGLQERRGNKDMYSLETL